MWTEGCTCRCVSVLSCPTALPPTWVITVTGGQQCQKPTAHSRVAFRCPTTCPWGARTTQNRCWAAQNGTSQQGGWTHPLTCQVYSSKLGILQFAVTRHWEEGARGSAMSPKIPWAWLASFIPGPAAVAPRRALRNAESAPDPHPPTQILCRNKAPR